MKKILLLLLICMCVVTGCIQRKEVSFSQKMQEYELYCAEEMKLDYAVKNEEELKEPLNFSSKDSNVVSVDPNGNVKALKAGQTVVSAKCDEKTVLKWEINVYDNCSISMKNKKDIKICIKNTASIDFSCSGGKPEDIFEIKSTDNRVATVDEKGNVIAQKEGECLIELTYGNAKPIQVKVQVGDYKKIYAELIKDIFEGEYDEIYCDDNLLISGSLHYMNDDYIPELAIYSGTAHSDRIHLFTIVDNEPFYIGEYGSWGYSGLNYIPKKSIIQELCDYNQGAGKDRILSLSNNGKVKELAGIDFLGEDSGNIFKYHIGEEECSKQKYEKYIKKIVSNPDDLVSCYDFCKLTEMLACFLYEEEYYKHLYDIREQYKLQTESDYYEEDEIYESNIYLDLDDDYRIDQISIHNYYDGDGYEISFYQSELIQDNFDSKLMNATWYTIIDIDKTDGHKDIVFGYGGGYYDGDIEELKIYHYIGDGNLGFEFEISNLKVDLTSIKVLGDNKLGFDKYIHDKYLGNLVFEVEYDVVGVKLKKCDSHNQYNLSDMMSECRYYAIKKLSLYQQPHSKKEVGKIKKKERFQPTKVYLNKKEIYLYVKTDNGKKGWLLVPNSYFYTYDLEFKHQINEWG